MQTSLRPVRFAYVGCGFVAQHIHIPNFRSLPNCEFLALAEVRPGLGDAVAKYYGIPRVYRSHEEIAADPDIEAVGVSGPYALQSRVAQDLLRAGKDVFMEKPMAVSVERAQAIVAAEKASGKRLMVGYMKRYDTGNVRLKQLADEWRAGGEVGRLLLGRNHGFCGNWVYANDPNVRTFAPTDNTPPPFSPDESPEWLPQQWHDGYMGYLQQYTHNVNLLRYFIGDPDGTAKVRQVDLDADGMTGLVTLEINGTRAIVESGSTSFHGWDEHTQLYFEGGWLRTEAPTLMHKENSASVEFYRGTRNGATPHSGREYTTPGWAYREEAKHFLHGVATGEPFWSTAQDTLTDVRLFEEIYRAFLTERGEI